MGPETAASQKNEQVDPDAPGLSVRRRRVLFLLFLIIGLAGFGFSVFYAAIYLKMATSGPGGIGLALVIVVLLLAQGGPIAGLGALLIGWLDDRGYSRSAKTMLTLVVLVLVAASLILTLVPLPALATLVLVILFASRLTSMRRLWIVIWLVYSIPCLVCDIVAVWFWWSSLR